MASTYKQLLEADIRQTSTKLHESIPLTGSIISGTYADNNIKNYAHGMFQSVYDYPYLSSSANHVLDLVACFSAQSALSGAAGVSQRSEKIDVYNGGEMYRDFTYIDDVTKSIELLINKIPSQNIKRKYKNDSLSNVAPFRIINIGNQKKVYLKDFISALEKKLNKKANKNNMSMQKGDVKKTLSNTNLLYQLIKYKPKVNYIRGISTFVDWFKKYHK